MSSDAGLTRWIGKSLTARVINSFALALLLLLIWLFLVVSLGPGVETPWGPISMKRNAIVIDSNAAPIGTIVATTLPADRFESANGGATKNWVICDGREAPADSAYRKFVGQNVPDLRGLFLRGANEMSPNAPIPPIADRINPDKKQIGDYQKDELASHAHKGSYDYWPHEGGGDGTVKGIVVPTGIARITFRTEYKVFPEGGNETRPKNLSVAYYIRVH